MLLTSNLVIAETCPGIGEIGHLARSVEWSHGSYVLRRRRGKRRQLEEVLEVLHGIGMMLMDIGARLETVVDLMKGGDDDGEPDT